MWQSEGARRCSTTSSQSVDAMPGHSFERRNKRAAARRGSFLLRTGPHRSCNVYQATPRRTEWCAPSSTPQGFTVRMTADFVRGRWLRWPIVRGRTHKRLVLMLAATVGAGLGCTPCAGCGCQIRGMCRHRGRLEVWIRCRFAAECGYGCIKGLRLSREAIKPNASRRLVAHNLSDSCSSLSNTGATNKFT